MTSAFKPFDEMTDEDYANLGLKSGIEIHQQLLTDKKLFCRCPAGLYNEEFHAEILRHMRPTLSELGEYDGTALMEFKTKKDIIYQINHESVCTYEMDDTPPFEINQIALEIALEIATLLNYKLVSEIHISRKQYLDGSIPTGFQRTTIVGIDGWIPYQDRKIGLIQLGLEEDACREVSDIGHTRIYRTDRLGMPLIEMVTQPEMYTPQEVAEVANILRLSVRSTGKVRTGIGAARQDVNVSIDGGTRVEIKGVPRIPRIPLLIYNEALRQHSLLQIRAELKKRGITSQSIKTQSREVTQFLHGTHWEPISQALQRGEEIHCINLKGFAGILRSPTQTGKVFSKEISDRVRVIACITRLPNILTSENTEETVGSHIWNKIQRAVKAEQKDSLILVWGNKEDVRTAVKEVILRAKEATLGIPNETRQALADGTNGFERILPGADRMYPDTDLPPLEIPESWIQNIKFRVKDNIWDREIRYRKIGLPEHIQLLIAPSPTAPFFEGLINNHSTPPVRIAHFLYEKTTAWRRQGLPVDKLREEHWNTFFGMVEKQPALLEKGDDIFKEFLTKKRGSIEKELKKFSPPSYDKKNIHVLIEEIIKQDVNSYSSIEKRHRFLMGRILDRCRGHLPAEEVSRKLWDSLKSTGDHHE